MPGYTGNQIRADQRAVTWMCTKGHGSLKLMSMTQKNFHNKFEHNGPTTKELFEIVGMPPGHDDDLSEKVRADITMMHYKEGGLGCQLVNLLPSSLRETFTRPGSNHVPLGTAKTPMDAAIATKFYPWQPQMVMHVGTHCGQDFPFDRVKASGARLEGIARNKVIFEMILGYLPHTSWAALCQVSATVAFGVSDARHLWTIGDGNVECAEYTDEEFAMLPAKDRLLCGGDAPRGAKILTVTTGIGSWRVKEQRRGRPSWKMIGMGYLRLCRALKLRGNTIQHLCVKFVPFVNHKVAAGLLQACPNLRKFELIGCGLMTLAELAPFLKHLQDVQFRRQKYIHFDAAPCYYKGPKFAESFNCENMLRTKRRGTYGVTPNDPGVDLGPAVLKVLVYEVLPAAEAADQMHMFLDLTSLCRQYLEALPLPKQSIPLMLKYWQYHADIAAMIDSAEVTWCEALWAANPQAHLTPPPKFTASDWPQDLAKDVARLRLRMYWLGARACFGDNGYKQTCDRGFYSSNYQCLPDNYFEWTEIMICDFCQLSLPRFMFNWGEICEGCRLDFSIDNEQHMSEPLIRNAITALGYGESYEPYVSNGHSNINFNTLTAGDLPVLSRSDFQRKMASTPSLQDFMASLKAIDAEDERVKDAKSRIQIRQVDNPFGEMPTLAERGATLSKKMPYRQTITSEEHDEFKGKGWTPKKTCNY